MDTLECPDCGGEMEIVAFIEDTRVVYKILDHLDMLTSETDPPRSPPEDSSRTYEPIESVRNPHRIEA